MYLFKLIVLSSLIMFSMNLSARGERAAPREGGERFNTRAGGEYHPDARAYERGLESGEANGAAQYAQPVYTNPPTDQPNYNINIQQGSGSQ